MNMLLPILKEEKYCQLVWKAIEIILELILKYWNYSVIKKTFNP